MLSDFSETLRLATVLAQAGTRADATTGAVSAPVHFSSTFGHPRLGESTGFDYSRTANPTRSALEKVLARIDGGQRGFAFSTGMAAVDAVAHLFRPGDRLLVTEDLYGGTYRLFDRILRPLGIEPVFCDTSSIEAVVQAADAGVKGVFVETLTNPLLKVADVRGLAKLCRERNWIFIADHTFLTPLAQRPLAMGADVVVYSATKYAGGHNDLLAGVVVTARPDIAEKIAFYQNSVGAVLGPFESWLLLRGLKTLPLRFRAQQDNALKIAGFLSVHPFVRRVYYPGLTHHAGHQRILDQAAGFGAMVAFEADTRARAVALLERVKVFIFAESLGGVESLVTYPLVQTHADMDAELRERLGIGDRLLRLSTGIEDADDLIADLKQALEG